MTATLVDPIPVTGAGSHTGLSTENHVVDDSRLRP
jgi:hypothetical protein